ncbi:unnamed protein product [Oikopleura dioica]|uniref:Argininosuccinate synthase n=1 Tax=Oikopleura dioica TaxID=34765 RepID=E4YIX1_OIKDI|nr:unnamed protein product [Oikopleura dioica]
MPETVVLAYSGGLDTSCILVYLVKQGYRVVACIADVGQDEDFEKAKTKALSIGASAIYVEDVKQEFVTDFIWPWVQSGAVYEEQYLLGTSLARPLISKALVRVARLENALFISHGATGKGNDQVRFELSIAALAPDIKIIAPWRDDEFCSKFAGRNDLFNFAEENKIPLPVTKSSPWSMDANLMHISYEAGILEDPSVTPPDRMWLMTKDPISAPDAPEIIELTFEKGLPVLMKYRDLEVSQPLDLFKKLNEIAGEHGVGRLDIIESRFVGMKSRGCYETPAGTVLLTAHKDLESLTTDREVIRLKQNLAREFSVQVYNGMWNSPEAQFTRKTIDSSQTFVNGTVKVQLYKGFARVIARTSPTSVYDATLASMDELTDYNPADAEGFIRINALRLKQHAKR